MLHHRRRLFVAALALTLFALPAAPLAAEEDDPAFTTIINVPPDEAPSEIGSNTQLNLDDGGELPRYFNAGAPDGSTSDIEVNIFGGSAGFVRAYSGSRIHIFDGQLDWTWFEANAGSEIQFYGGFSRGRLSARSGSTVRLSGGYVRQLISYSGGTAEVSGGAMARLISYSDSTVNISGGRVGEMFRAESGSTVNLSGGEFRLNGNPVDALPNGLTTGDLFTATLADGSVLVVAPQAPGITTAADLIATDAIVNLDEIRIPELGPLVLNVPSMPAPHGLRAGQTLNLDDGGELPNSFSAVDAKLHVAGGSVGLDLKLANSDLNISGGVIATGLRAHAGSEIDVAGGKVEGTIGAYSGTVIDLSQGSLQWPKVYAGSEFRQSGGYASGVDVYAGASASLSGGSVGGLEVEDGGNATIVGGSHRNIYADSGSVLEISGGRFGGDFRAETGSDVRLLGGEFHLNGQPITALPDEVANDAVLTGVFADGSSFVLGPKEYYAAGAISLIDTPVPAPAQMHYEVPTDAAPNGLRFGQTLHLPTAASCPRASRSWMRH